MWQSSQSNGLLWIAWLSIHASDFMIGSIACHLDQTQQRATKARANHCCACMHFAEYCNTRHLNYLRTNKRARANVQDVMLRYSGPHDSLPDLMHSGSRSTYLQQWNLYDLSPASWPVADHCLRGQVRGPVQGLLPQAMMAPQAAPLNPFLQLGGKLQGLLLQEGQMGLMKLDWKPRGKLWGKLQGLE